MDLRFPSRFLKVMLSRLGEPPQDGEPYPLPDCITSVFVATSSIHSPKLLLVDQEEIGLSQYGPEYIAPAGLGRGKVIVLAKQTVGSFCTEDNPRIVMDFNGLILDIRHGALMVELR